MKKRAKGSVPQTKQHAQATEVTQQHKHKVLSKTEKFSTVAEAIPQILWIKKPNDQTTYYNQRWFEYSGYTHEYNPGSRGIMHPEDRPNYVRLWQKSRLTGQTFEMEFRLKRNDGMYRWFLGRAVPIRDKKKKIVKWIGTATDIHNQKHIEELIASSEKRFRALIENSSDAIFLLNREGKIVYASPSTEKVFGYAPEECIGKISPDFIHPDDRKNRKEALEYLLKYPEHVVTLEYRRRHKDGSWRWIEATGTNLFKDSFVGAIVLNCHDITERKELEQRKDEFISMASHELKSPVTSLKLYTSVLKNKKTRDKESKELLERMNSQISKLTNLIDDLLDLSKIQAGKLEFRDEWFDINVLIKDTVEHVQAMSHKHAIIVKGKAKHSVIGDQDRISQVIINLLTNAIKYDPDGGKIYVTVSENKDNITVSVKDFGIGIDKKQQARIFDRFYQGVDPLEKTFPGLGIGLYISAEIIKHHEGKLWVESKLGKGSTFSFTLPIKNLTIKKKTIAKTKNA